MSGLRSTVPLLLLLVVAAGLVGGAVALATGGAPHLIGLPLAAAALAAAALLGLRSLSRGDARIGLDVPSGEVHSGAAALAAAPVTRRVVLGGVGAVGAAAGALALTGPEEAPGTSWAAGRYVVTGDGRRILARDFPVGGFATVWPEGHVGQVRSAVALMRLATGPAEPPTVLDWVVRERIVGYSKICTHAGCAVDLYRTGTDELYCPCHQAMFAADRGAVPVFGPAAVALPQLPLGTDAAGFLIATGDFVRPVGPYRA